jgi:hypothetical protein
MLRKLHIAFVNWWLGKYTARASALHLNYCFYVLESFEKVEK